MELGDIVLYREVRWKIIGFSSDLNLFTLSKPDGAKVEVPDDVEALEDLKVLYHPSMWPFAVYGALHKTPLVSIMRNGRDLEILEDWVPTSFTSSGGSIFFNPALKLRKGEVLVGVHANGLGNSRITLSPKFGTLVSRAKKEVKKEPETILDRLMSQRKP